MFFVVLLQTVRFESALSAITTLSEVASVVAQVHYLQEEPFGGLLFFEG